MRSYAHPIGSAILLASLFAGVFKPASAGTRPANPPLRWTEGRPGCTFSRDDDGKYRYGLWTDDFGVVLAVDSQELEKSRRRIQPVLALLLRFRHRGKTSLDVAPAKVTLEFVNHYREVQSALAPDVLAGRLSAALNQLNQQTEREIRRHPEKAEARQAELKAQQENVSQMTDFLHKNSLVSTKLDAQNADALGWVFFDIQSRWTAAWKKQEKFVLRIALGDQMVEFPFVLPPSQGDLILRRRP